MATLGMKKASERAIVFVGMPALAHLTDPHVFEFVVEQGLKPEHALLDVGAGCLGPGRLFINYLDEGNYWAVEPNDWLIKESGVPRSLFHLYTFDDFKLARIKYSWFDFVLAHSIFTHADQAQVRTILQEAYIVLECGGKLVASFYKHGNDSEHEGWLWPIGCAYTVKFIEEQARRVGFEAQIIDDKRHPINHTWLVARKPDDTL